jgi:hypothetical protein
VSVHGEALQHQMPFERFACPFGLVELVSRGIDLLDGMPDAPIDDAVCIQLVDDGGPLARYDVGGRRRDRQVR